MYMCRYIYTYTCMYMNVYQNLLCAPLAASDNQPPNIIWCTLPCVVSRCHGQRPRADAVFAPSDPLRFFTWQAQYRESPVFVGTLWHQYDINIYIYIYKWLGAWVRQINFNCMNYYNCCNASIKCIPYFKLLASDVRKWFYNSWNDPFLSPVNEMQTQSAMALATHGLFGSCFWLWKWPRVQLQLWKVEQRNIISNFWNGQMNLLRNPDFRAMISINRIYR